MSVQFIVDLKKHTSIQVNNDLFSEQYFLSNINFQKLTGKYISMSIDEDMISTWNSQAPILIKAQTGKGKNYFVINTLRIYAKKSKKEILYVSNRVALHEQQKKLLADAVDLPHWERTNLKFKTKFDNVTVITYQQLTSSIFESNVSFFSQFNYVVFDECHYFCSDAEFNLNTANTLERIPQLFSNAVRIYMSSTFDDVLEPIVSQERNNYTLDSPFRLDDHIIAYETDYDYGYLNCQFFSKTEPVIEQAKSSTDKWIFFVSSKKSGQKLLNDLGEDRAIFVHGNTRDNGSIAEKEVLECIEREGSFSCQFLITTKVLDNGVSFFNKSIKNIVVFVTDKITFLQEIGRIRNPESTINLFIEKASQAKMSHLRKKLQDNLDICTTVLDNESPNQFRKISEMLNYLIHTDNETSLLQIVPTDTGITIRSSWAARWSLSCQVKRLKTYNELYEKNEETAPMLYIAQWMNLALNNYIDLDEIYKDNSAKKLIMLLEDYANKGLIPIEADAKLTASVNWSKFYLDFIDLFEKAYPDATQRNRSIQREIQGYRAVNGRLQHIVSEKHVYNVTIQKKPYLGFLISKSPIDNVSAQPTTDDTYMNGI